MFVLLFGFDCGGAYNVHFYTGGRRTKLHFKASGMQTFPFQTLLTRPLPAGTDDNRLESEALPAAAFPQQFFSPSKSKWSQILTNFNCDLQVFPSNSVKHVRYSQEVRLLFFVYICFLSVCTFVIMLDLHVKGTGHMTP